MSDTDFEAVDDVAPVSINEETSSENSMSVVMAKLKPYLTRAEDEQALLDQLTNLGVVALADLKFIEWEKDFVGLITTIKCRRLKEEISRELEVAPSTSANNAEAGASGTSGYRFDPKTMSQTLQKRLEKKKRVSDYDRRKLVQTVGMDLYAAVKKPCPVQAMSVARSLVALYSAALKDDHCEEGHEGLGKQILQHMQYLHRTDKNSDDEDESGTPKRKRMRFSKKKLYGIDENQFLPCALPANESPEDQDEKQAWLLKEFSHTPVDIKRVKQLMMETYVSQRATIVEKQLDVGEILQEWPFLGKYTFLKGHFYELMKLKEEDCVNRMNTLLPSMMAFLRQESNHVIRGKKGEVPRERTSMIEIFKLVDARPDATVTQNFIVMVENLAIMLDCKFSSLFLRFPEATSYDEVAASDKLPEHPVIAVPGEDPLIDLPTCYVFVDKCGLFQEKLNPVQALLHLFMCHYVFSVDYTRQHAALLEFIQRDVFGITGEGSKTERLPKKRNPPPMQGKYDGLMRKFASYKARWNTSSQSRSAEPPAA